MRRFAPWLLLLAALVACRSTRREDAPSSIGQAPQDDARLVLEKHCGLCHLDDSPQAKPRALAVFNLRRPDWYTSISPDQLRSARARLADAPTGGDPASPTEVATFDAFVATELARRENRKSAD